MLDEQKGLLEQLQQPTKRVRAGRTFWCGQWAGHDVVLVLSKIGKVAAASTTVPVPVLVRLPMPPTAPENVIAREPVATEKTCTALLIRIEPLKVASASERQPSTAPAPFDRNTQ